VTPVPAPVVGRRLKLEAVNAVTELLWNLGPVKPLSEGEMYIRY